MAERRTKTPTPYQRSKEKLINVPQVHNKQKYYYNRICSQLRADHEKKEILGHDAKIKTVSIIQKYEVFRKDYLRPQKPIKRFAIKTDAELYVQHHPNTYLFSWN